MNSKRATILATVDPEDFVGRKSETEVLLEHARGARRAAGLHVLAAPGVGVSELLKQAYDRLFFARGETIPFYFAFKESDCTAARAALRFLQEFLAQAIAFRREKPELLKFGGDFEELASLALPSDAAWTDRLFEACRDPQPDACDRGFLRTVFGAPLRAAAQGARVFFMIDDFHEAETLAGADLVDELSEIYARAAAPFVVASRRRFHFDKKKLNLETLSVKPLAFAPAGALAENLARGLRLKISEQARDLVAVQFGGNPLYTRALLQSAADQRMDLESFGAVQKVYADEIFGGRLSRYYDRLFERAAPSAEGRRQLLGLLYDALTSDAEKNRLDAWRGRFAAGAEDFAQSMRLLSLHELIRASADLVEPMRENRILSDYVEARFRLEIAAANRALTVGETLAEFFKRAPRTMAAFYRQRSAIGLRELLGVFNCQQVPRGLLDYAVFKNELKGAPHHEILKSLGAEKEKIALPQIVYTAHTVAFYAPLAEFVERARSAVALGFQESSYTDEDETVWIAAEIDSKLEASKELAESWCDRLEMVALICNFVNYKIWLVAPEGFAPAAVEMLGRRGALGSSRKQVALLIDYLGAKKRFDERAHANEYEMIVPIGGDTELIAAQTVEEIARRHHFAPKAINQIKTALVEACISAAEHSPSPDRKIYQKFAVEDDRLVITIANRGLRTADKKAREVNPEEGRRGWGLKLMKTLMDEVRFEQTDDGTRISMTKYLAR